MAQKQQAPVLSLSEQKIVLGQPISEGSDSIAASLSMGNYEDVLRSEAGQAVFGSDLDSAQASAVLSGTSPFSDEFAAVDLRSYVGDLVQRYVNEHGPKGWQQVTLVGAACLNAFLQTNWTGPDMPVDPAALLPKPLAERWAESFISSAKIDLPEDADAHEVGRREQTGGRVYLGAKQSEERQKLDQQVLRFMECDGEEAYTLTPRPLYLYFARLLLVDLPDGGSADVRDTHAPLGPWLAARVLRTQQGLLEYPSQTLLDAILDSYARAARHLPDSPVRAKYERSLSERSRQESMDADIDFMQTVPSTPKDAAEEEPLNSSDQMVTSSAEAWASVDNDTRELWTRYLLEIGIVYAQHKMPVDTKTHVTEAQAASGLQWRMTGVKGKRTRFQESSFAQLVVEAHSTRESAVADSEEAPETMALNSDVLLEKVEYTEEAPAVDALAIVDKCILLALCQNVQNENPAHGLTSEQMMPFAERVLDRTSNWSVYTMGLLQRSRIESSKTRTVERATLQIQALVDQITRPLPKAKEAGGAERLAYLHVLTLPSHWALEAELAQRYMSLGIVRSALDIFERLQMWDETITAFLLLGQTEVAERMVRSQLELTPDRAKLWCHLGDLKRDPEHWRHAWEVSNHRYARAMRALGGYHFERGEFAESAECLRKALALNPIFDKSWYMLGCAELKLENWSGASHAFQRVVSLDYDNGEAWNNLASSYLYQGSENKDRAWYALREATKQTRDSWMIWSNFMTVSISLGQFATAIHAMCRIVALRASSVGAACVDLDALQAIIGALVHGEISQGLAPADAERKEQQHARYVEHLLVNEIEPRITRSAPLWHVMAKFWSWRQDYQHCLDCYIKAYRCLSQQAEVSYEEPLFAQAVDAVIELVSMYENLGDRVQTVRVATAGDQEAPGDAEERKAAAVAQPVCPDWKRQAKMALRGLIGKGKENFEGTANYNRLVDALQELNQS
ncbi:hypothetical protein GGI07_005740 [Coemansia sp. Benny D115]|nr:hypothetical protein GGI07_005740 [Coemansia sp. Benny D115]